MSLESAQSDLEYCVSKIDQIKTKAEERRYRNDNLLSKLNTAQDEYS